MSYRTQLAGCSRDRAPLDCIPPSVLSNLRAAILELQTTLLKKADSFENVSSRKEGITKGNYYRYKDRSTRLTNIDQTGQTGLQRRHTTDSMPRTYIEHTSLRYSIPYTI